MRPSLRQRPWVPYDLAELTLNANQLAEALSRTRNRPERDLWFGASLADASRPSLVIVGGSAIEVYTSGPYESADFDVVGDRSPIIASLERWEFRKEGGPWTRKDLELWVDPVGGEDTGDERRLREVATPYDPVRLASVEDLIAKRLIEIKV
jgi:hypothetical protein